MALSTEELSELRKKAVEGSAHQPSLHLAAALDGRGYLESDRWGGVRITAEGRKYLRDVDSGVVR